MKSLRQQLDELYEAQQLGRIAFSNWEEGFILSVYDKATKGTQNLTDKQVEKIDELFSRYFDS